MDERSARKTKNDVALQAHSIKEKKYKGRWNGNKGSGSYNNSNDRGN